MNNCYFDSLTIPVFILCEGYTCASGHGKFHKRQSSGKQEYKDTHAHLVRH